jgi:hypothetical protein
VGVVTKTYVNHMKYSEPRPRRNGGGGGADFTAAAAASSSARLCTSAADDTASFSWSPHSLHWRCDCAQDSASCCSSASRGS